MHLNAVIVPAILSVCVAACIVLKKLTPPAAITGGLLGWVIYAGVGYPGLILLALFFVIGTAATSWKKKEKLQLRGAAEHQSTRNTGQVFANAGVAAITGLLAILMPSCRPLFFLMAASALSSAAADTLSSELGMVYGRRFFNILSWKPDERGLDGVVSTEGLLIGMAGSLFSAIFYGLFSAWDLRVLIVVVSGTIGNLADSYLGALFERRGYLSNDVVNFLNTLIAAVCAGALVQFH